MFKQPLAFPLGPAARARTYAVAKSAHHDLDPGTRDQFISEVTEAFSRGFQPEFDAGKAEGAAQVRDEVARISEHASFSVARDLALGLYFATGDASFVLSVLSGIGDPIQPIDQSTAPALFLRQNGYSPEAIGAAIAGRK